MDYFTAIDHYIKIIEKWNKDQHLEVHDYFSIFLLIITAITAIKNSLLLNSIKSGNILTYLNKEAIKQTLYIEDLLNQLLLLLDCSRVCIGLFHNGTSLGGFAFKKMSVFYEARRSDAISLKDTIKNIDLNKLNEHLYNLNDDYFTEIDRDNENLSNDCKRYLDFANLKAVYSVLLKNNKKIYGILEIQYLKNNERNINNFKDIEIQEEKEVLINKILKSLSYIVENKKIPNIQ